MKRFTLPGAAVLVGALVAGGYFTGAFTHGQVATTANRSLAQDPVSFRNVVKRVLPAVVSIEAKTKPVKVSGKKPVPFDDPRVPEEFRKFFEEFGRMPEGGGEPRLGFGSGFVIEPQGTVLTNFHVIAGAESVIVQLNDGRKFTSKDIRGDKRTDLAIVRLDTKGAKLPYLEMGDSEAMEIGDRVLAVGAPFGLAGSVTHGIVSAKGRNGLAMNMYEDFLQTDAAINPGNSGGPLVNLDGQVVGINSAIKTRSGGFQGVGLAISSNMAKNIVKALITDGVVRRGYLGVQIRELDPEVAERLQIPKDTGVVVGEVFDNTPGAKAGLEAGDVITAIAGKTIRDGRGLQNTVAALPLNKPVEVSIVRDGQAKQLAVTIEEQPDRFGRDTVPAPRRNIPEGDATALANIGVEVAELTEEMAEAFGYRKGATGVVIAKVDTGGLAASAGLRRGMLITRVDNRKVADVATARHAIEKASLARGVLLQVQSPTGGTNFVLLRSENSSKEQ